MAALMVGGSGYMSLEHRSSARSRALGALSQMCARHLLQAQLAFHCFLVHSESIASHGGSPVAALQSASDSARQMKQPAGHASKGETWGQKSQVAG
eukprot:3164366-Pyramimonas_sp.AAC.1